jgi:tetratricopeptide (TPR) repeat protein
VLGFVYEHHKDFQSAINAHKRAVETAPEKDKARRITRLADAYSQNGQTDVGISTLISALPTFREGNDRALIFDGLASIYEQTQNHEMRAISLDLALEARPFDMSLRFKAARAYSQDGLHDLALLHYNDDVNVNPNAEAAWNNLGVEFEHFDLPIKAVSSYRESLAQKNSLAGANLAYRFLDAGFFNEAKAVLDDAKHLEDVHQNVASAIAALTQRSEAEDQSVKEILRRADREQKFLREFGKAYFTECAHSFSGNWRRDDGEIIPIETVEGKLTADWVYNSRKKKLTGTIHGCAGKLTITSEPETGFLTALERVESSVHAYLGDAGTHCHAMFFEKGSPTFGVWARV